MLFHFQNVVWFGKRQLFCFLITYIMCSFLQLFQMPVSLLNGSAIFTNRLYFWYAVPLSLLSCDIILSVVDNWISEYLFSHFIANRWWYRSVLVLWLYSCFRRYTGCCFYMATFKLFLNVYFPQLFRYLPDFSKHWVIKHGEHTVIFWGLIDKRLLGEFGWGAL